MSRSTAGLRGRNSRKSLEKLKVKTRTWFLGRRLGQECRWHGWSMFFSAMKRFLKGLE